MGLPTLPEFGSRTAYLKRWPPDSTTIIGAGILIGVVCFWATGIPEVGLIAAAAVKILMPQHRPGEREEPIEFAEEVAEALA